LPVKLSCGGCSFQFGRTLILFPRLPHLAQTTREGNDGTSVSASEGKISEKTQTDSSVILPLGRYLKRLIASRIVQRCSECERNGVPQQFALGPFLMEERAGNKANIPT
jgi:hypothetical protein